MSASYIPCPPPPSLSRLPSLRLKGWIQRTLIATYAFLSGPEPTSQQCSSQQTNHFSRFNPFLSHSLSLSHTHYLHSDPAEQARDSAKKKRRNPPSAAANSSFEIRSSFGGASCTGCCGSKRL